MSVRTFGIAGATETAESFRLAASGMWVPASAINTRTGVTSVPVLTGTGAFTCTVSPFTMVIDGTSNSLQGSYMVAVDATTLVTITAADAAARTDLICVQIQDNPYDASGQSRGQVLYVKGTSGGGIPSTPANSIVLWQVPVGASASSVTFGSATAVFPYTAAAGGIVPARNATDKPTVVNAVQYRHRLDVAAGGVSPLEWSTDGTTYTPVFDPTPYQYTWTTFATVWTGGVTPPAIGNGGLTMRYMKIGRLVCVRLNMFAGSTTTFGSGTWNFSLPFSNATVGMISGNATAYCGSSTPGYYGTCEVVGNTCIAIMGSGSNFVGPTSPATWVSNNNNSLDMTFFYESTT